MDKRKQIIDDIVETESLYKFTTSELPILYRDASFLIIKIKFVACGHIPISIM